MGLKGEPKEREEGGGFRERADQNGKGEEE